MEKRLFSEKYRILSGSALKTIALITMLIDHTTMTFLSGSKAAVFTIAGHTLLWYDLLRGVGRLAFPIYVFLLTEGFIHTRNRTKYGGRLLAFALISEIPWNLLHNGTVLYIKSQNVFFTLFLGFLALCAMDRYRDDMKKQALSLVLPLIASLNLHADYGATGFGFILTVYLLRENELSRAIVGSCFLSSRWKAGLAFIPIGMYNGRRGYIKSAPLQYAFYAIYPAHMLLLYYLISR